METNENESSLVYALVANIPADYHSADLRKFFSQLIEREGFDCFHFRHRPEGKNPDKATHDADLQTSSATPTSTTVAQSKMGKGKTCCLIRLKEGKYRELAQLYHKKHWINEKRESIRSLCFISKVNISASSASDSDKSKNECLQKYKTRMEMRTPSTGNNELTQEDLDNLLELRPPDIMPNGNVGTPTKIFLELIRACRLPPKVISKLGLNFPMARDRKYGNVRFNYVNKEWRTSGRGLLRGQQRDSTGQQAAATSSCVSDADDKESVQKSPHDRPQSPSPSEEPSTDEERDAPSEEDDDDDGCEEWERHEALHDDPANYERNKERAFEEKLEVVWEKGGSGLVFYTDEKYWREQDGDFDEQTADDWDVDMSQYYDPNGGDMDARDLLTMRHEQRRRQAHDDDDLPSTSIGKFERHTRGIGRKVLEQQGWEEGSGVGSTIKGMADALDNDGQKPTDKSGFGYRGEKLKRGGAGAAPKRRREDQDQFLISTVYDKPKDMEIPETLFRRTDHKLMKYRAGSRC